MARADTAGLFWDDTPPPKAPKKEAEKRTPPDPIWERDDYLPGLKEALEFNVSLMSNDDLFQAYLKRERLVLDVECYWNYFLCAFKSLTTGKVFVLEMYEGHPLDIQKFQWVMENFLTVGFNSNTYDVPIITMALAGCTNHQLKEATNIIILQNERGGDVLKSYKIKKKTFNHIDLFEVAPGVGASLKIYGGRLHTKRMQDLPFHPEKFLSPDQIAITRWYCLNDLVHTELLNAELRSQIELREVLSDENKIDLRSKSDAQIAEAVIAKDLKEMTGRRPERPYIEIGTSYRYQTPHFLKYYSPTMQWALSVVQNAWFVVDNSGSIGMPQELSDLEIPIGNSKYRMGIGGLHSCEKSSAHWSDKDYEISDHDVTSFYPMIILILGLFPQHLGREFLVVYRRIVERRIAAKEGAKELKKLLKQADLDPVVKIRYQKELTENTTIADSLKITINGSFGKLGSMFSVLYSPNLLIQVTVTGQLSLLMLIERMELSGISVISANTDGIVIKCPRNLIPVRDAIIKQWEQETGFETEGTKYKALLSRDVNNYIALKEDGDHKVKGVYSEKGSNGNSVLSKNPTGLISSDAVIEFLKKGTPIGQTIRSCKDMRRFVFVRRVNGGAVKIWDDHTEYLGKNIRWYYAEGVTGEIVYAKNGNKVPRSDNAKPMMEMPEECPSDINYEWYEKESYKMLKEIGLAHLA